ncbi:MAG: hypothetical protein BGO29_12770 [Bacteroidales bacterium 36-12]|jgi:hypothetical protein|nr:MAG: hypothetical protein BGO29_12770 [Bacteroidales bacterium 36-12]
MAEKVEHGRSKLISNYGGIGSVIDTIDCSIIIESFDNWHYPSYFDKELNQYIIIDDRLLNRLKARFPLLKQIVSIPTEDGFEVQPQANIFPKWFYCPRCKRFMHYNDWKNHWQDKNNFNVQCFNPECKGEHLEQVRFVMTCDNGHIQDLPWNFWNNRKPVDETKESAPSEEENSPKIVLKYEKCCEEQQLIYEISNENTDLSGIRIKCKKCGKSESLKGIFNFQQKCGGQKYWLGFQNGSFVKEECDEKTTVKIKSSNSIYYANSLNSLWIPEKQSLELDIDLRTEIDAIVNDPDFEPKDLEKFSRRNGVDIQLINSYLDNHTDEYVTELLYRKAEYDYFITKQQPEDKKIRFRQIEVKNQLFGFDKLIKIDKLKKTTVQTSFTRNEPIDVDSILVGDTEYVNNYNVKRQSLSKNNFETRLLPAVESYGEGILFVLDKKLLNEWESKELIINRANTIKQHGLSSDWKSHQIEAARITPRKILIHSLAHLLIREFEYICGYPMSSLQERLYVDSTMNGFLISAYDGTDGYLGGLSKLCNNIENLNKIIQSALNRAKNCSLDPICYESDGQGIAQLNLAACHSCTLLPETSCEHGNLFLDRKLVVDEEFGYFKNLI